MSDKCKQVQEIVDCNFDMVVVDHTMNTSDVISKEQVQNNLLLPPMTLGTAGTQFQSPFLKFGDLLYSVCIAFLHLVVGLQHPSIFVVATKETSTLSSIVVNNITASDLQGNEVDEMQPLGPQGGGLAQTKADSLGCDQRRASKASFHVWLSCNALVLDRSSNDIAFVYDALPCRPRRATIQVCTHV